MKFSNNYILPVLIGFTALISSGSIYADKSEDANKLNELIKNCGMCHGTDGNSLVSTTPSIAGMTPEFFKHTMDSYKNDGRKSDLMKNFAHLLSDNDVDLIANYYATQNFKPREQKFDSTLAAAGEKLHNKYCEKCHENGGRITENNYGVLAGQWMPYIRKSIQDYLDKNRKVNPMMITKLNSLKKEAGEEGIEQIVHYYASLK